MAGKLISWCCGIGRNSSDDCVDDNESVFSETTFSYRQLNGEEGKKTRKESKTTEKATDRPNTNTNTDRPWSFLAKFGVKPDFVDLSKRARKVNMRGKQRVSMDDFLVLHTLGSGSFGKVFLTRKINGPDAGTLYALKQTKKTLNNPRVMMHAVVERRVLEHVRDSPFMVTLHYAFQTNSTLNLVMDFVNGGDFYNYQRKVGKFEENEARFYIAELVLALETFHTMGIIYRDLKPENILLDAEGHIVLTDFGLCKEFDPQKVLYRAWSYVGTNEYLAPEVSVRSDNSYDFATDWWALGVVTYEFLVGSLPFSLKDRTHRPSRFEMKNVILTTEPNYPEFLSPSAKHFIRALLTKDPTRRLGANGFQEVKNHPFFKDLDWDVLARKGYAVPRIPDTTHPADVSNFAQFDTIMPLTSSSGVDLNPLTGYSYVGPSPSSFLSDNTTISSTSSSSSDHDQSLL